MAERLAPDTKIQGTEFNISDFWSWGFSDILTNSLRGVFAEFLVGSTLDVLHQPRIEWDAYDLMYKDKKIEVKSAAYIQSWHEGQYSKISFGIEAKRAYNYETRTYTTEPIRNADLYVFCLLYEKDANLIDVLNTEQWHFYIVQTTVLNTLFPLQKRISLSTLEKVTQPVAFTEIKETIDLAINQ
ncbi:hypothetical protein QUF84_17700 [Fictibacillus enclensis]|uniref:hypothetical protein n=1 Tax=Fictibacillus enclensis TaxID=1017270 RepID=UPI0025A2A74C|nr:hypothetical protein [Fictibacillus enclensis]MDM5339047.1 hypothetical protein [Fictibacillus enclensis]